MVKAPVFILCLITLCYIPECLMQTITVEGYFGNIKKLTYEVFDAQANLPESLAHCQTVGMGKASTSPVTFMYVRAKLLEYGWPESKPLVFPLYYPYDATYKWYDVSRCTVYRRNDGVSLTESPTERCAKIIMDPLSQYIWEPVNCSTKLPFLCHKGHNIESTGNETYIGMQIDKNITDESVSFNVFTNMSTPLDCEEQCLRKARVCIAVEVVQINETDFECTGAMINFKQYFHVNMSVQVNLIPAPDNYTVFVKGLNQSDEVIINNGSSFVTSINFTENNLGCTYNYDFPTTTLAPNCSCLCSFTNYTDAELQAWIQQVKNELILNKKKLSSNARKKISASDPRASSQTIGSFGAIVIVTVIGIIVIPDIPLILKQIKYLSKR
ncbi:uncharacterized protein LOC133192188 [Saccostrea echinata]|uniref:uncharacterized protein LOC133192188 n=1 Tax=Saccostrea echinata TaxID=191078 RepID=UPI002A7FA9AF|nr:uncharacterized protein LOC133192188 [Saccostrea echinata]